MKLNLGAKLTLAFVLVALVGVVIVAVLANQATASGFRFYLQQDQLAQQEALVDELADYYMDQHGWEGVSGFLQERLGGPGRSGVFYQLQDADGAVVASSSGGRGRLMSEAATTHAIQVNGRLAGNLVLSITGGGMGSGQSVDREQQFLAQVNQAVVWAGLVALAAALGLGWFLARRLTRPIRQLTAATQTLAREDQVQAVPVTSHDELGELAASFNQMAADLARNRQQRQQIIADIAHELRTPLSVMRGHLEGMLDGVFPQTPENLVLVHEETLLLRRLVDELRTLSLAEAGQLPLNREVVDLAALAQQAATGFVPLAEAENVTLTVDLLANVPPVPADPARMQQVLGNLIANGLRHAPQGGGMPPEVWVSVTAVPGGVQVSVSDNGPGLSREQQQHVFDRFWRADPARNRAQGGSGLGLAICQGIVTAHDGRIWVESELERGATFHFILPLATDESA